jgi:hypothetical protein
MKQPGLSSTRRTFLQQSAVAGLALPVLGAAACSSQPAAGGDKAAITGGDPAGVPLERPSAWDVIHFNMARGEAGAIPAAYMAQIKAADGVAKHLGKHLPWLPADLPADRALAGYLAIMWGDPAKSYAAHPNAPRSEQNPEGHWYNWIRVAIAGQPASELETRFDDWPKCTDNVKGRLVGHTDADPAAMDGKNSVYLAQLPTAAKAGDTLRIWAHCLTHGEYVEFVTI